MTDDNESWQDFAQRLRDEEDALHVAAYLLCFIAAATVAAMVWLGWPPVQP